jgi:hypothetical protein
MYVASVFIWRLYMLYTYVASVLSECYVCLQWIFKFFLQVFHTHVLSVSFVFFCMLQVLHPDVSKVDWDVKHVAVVFQVHVLNVLYVFRRMLWIFYINIAHIIVTQPPICSCSTRACVQERRGREAYMWKIERAKIETWPHVGICMHGNRAARRKYVYFLKIWYSYFISFLVRYPTKVPSNWWDFCQKWFGAKGCFHPPNRCSYYRRSHFHIQGVFTSHTNSKYFLFHSSHRIFRRMHGVLNVGKKITNCIVCM